MVPRSFVKGTPDIEWVRPKCAFRAKRDGLRHGRQSYRCVLCGYVFRRTKSTLPISYQDFIAFWRYSAKGVDQDTLCEDLGISRQELSSRLRYFLTLPPMGDLIASIVPPRCTQPG